MSWLRRRRPFALGRGNGRAASPYHLFSLEVMRKVTFPGLIAGRFAIGIECAKSSGPILPRS